MLTSLQHNPTNSMINPPYGSKLTHKDTGKCAIAECHSGIQCTIITSLVAEVKLSPDDHSALKWENRYGIIFFTYTHSYTSGRWVPCRDNQDASLITHPLSYHKGFEKWYTSNWERSHASAFKSVFTQLNIFFLPRLLIVVVGGGLWG